MKVLNLITHPEPIKFSTIINLVKPIATRIRKTLIREKNAEHVLLMAIQTIIAIGDGPVNRGATFVERWRSPKEDINAEKSRSMILAKIQH